jgi:hypothetical protein
VRWNTDVLLDAWIGEDIMATAIVTVVDTIVIGKGCDVLDAPITGVVSHPLQ